MRTLGAALALATLATACREPTQVIVAVSNDFACTSLTNVSVTVGPALADLASQPPGTVTERCDPATGYMGDLVLVPSGSNDASFALRVVGAVGVPLEACDGPDPAGSPDAGKGCIIASRALGFIPHTPLTLPVELHDECIGVICGPDLTCVEGGVCADPNIDPVECEDGCGEEELPGIGGASGAVGGGGSGGAGAGGGQGGSAGAGGAPPPTNGGECMTSAECGDPGTCECVELSPGGYRVCQCPPIVFTDCTGTPACCKGSDCMPGQGCYSTDTQQFCGGGFQTITGVCLDDTPCPAKNCPPSTVCVPGGAFGKSVAECIPAACKLDVDCNAKPGGACIPYRYFCCSQPQEMACAYPPDGCQDSARCMLDEHCEVNSGEAACVPMMDQCPQ